MKSLLCIAAVISVLLTINAAPQFLTLNSSTVSELKDLTTTSLSELTSPEKTSSTTSVSSENEELSNKEFSPSSLESSTTSFKVNEELAETSDDRIKNETILVDDSLKLISNAAESDSDSNDSVEDFTNAGTTSLKPTENSETLNESEIPITRYVPPLDPIKNMLLMADIKGMSSFQHFVPKFNLKPESTTSENPTSKEVETTVNGDLISHSHVTEKITESSEINEKLVTEETPAASTEIMKNESHEAATENAPENIFEVESTEKIPSDEYSEKIVNNEPALTLEMGGDMEDLRKYIQSVMASKMAEKNISEPSQDEYSKKIVQNEPALPTTAEEETLEQYMKRIMASKLAEKIISEPSEVEEKVAEETTIRDFTTTSSIALLNSEELSSVKEPNSETSTVNLGELTSVEDFSSKISIDNLDELDSVKILDNETLTDNSDELTSLNILDSEISNDYSSPLTPTTYSEDLDMEKINTEFEEKAAAILKNSDTEVNVNITDILNKNITGKEDEITSAIFSSTEEAIHLENATSSDKLLNSNNELKTDLTDSIAEITTISSISPISLTEMDTIHTSTAKEILELTNAFTTTQTPETTSKEITKNPESEIVRKNISLDDELEFRAVKFPQNMSKVIYAENEPVDLDDAGNSEVTSETTPETETITSSIFTKIAEMLLSSTSTEIPTTLPEMTETEAAHETSAQNVPLQTDSDSVISHDSSDALEIQPVKVELNSIPTEETTVAASSTESISIELEPEELIKKDLEREMEDENTQSENFSETTEKIYTTTSTTLKFQSTTEQFIPTTLTPSETEKIVTDLEVSPSDKDTKDQNNDPSKQKHAQKQFNSENRYVSGNNTNIIAAVQFLHYHDKTSSEQCYKLVNSHWNYATNLTEENKIKQLEQTLQYSLYHKAAWKNATSFAWKRFNDTLLRRWFKSLSVLGNAALPEEKLNEFNRLKAEMKNTYSTSKICTYIPPEDVKKGHILQEKDCNLTLEPDLTRILTKSRNYDELVHVWKSWRDAAGKQIKDKYLRFVELGNEAARINGFSDIGDMWREAYETESFETDLEELWEQVRPLYENLHAYVRRRLIRQYGSDKIKEDGPIPAHLFGNMWAQSWVSLLDITQPFSGKPSVDVTPIMQAKNMTAYEMFKISEEFFTSLGLKSMPESFWKYSVIEKPKDREIICHASAWDFCNGEDYRIKQCTDITMEDLITVHHEMGHIQYFLQYARQPNVFREGANPGFHEAIGDVIALSVSTPKHLQSIDLLDEVADDPEGDLNFLLYTALDKVSFLPTGYLIELWRWGLFSGDIKPEEMNTKWWELRLKYQGVCPPVKRTDADFDPGAKFHIPGHVPYIRYFVSFVIQFQFHKVLCDAAGHTGPLYKCDIYRSKEAGQILSQVMELGSSEHWSEAMKIMTGGATNKMDAGPILEYFEPLLNFLKEQNKNETLGWRSEDPTICP